MRGYPYWPHHTSEAYKQPGRITSSQNAKRSTKHCSDIYSDIVYIPLHQHIHYRPGTVSKSIAWMTPIQLDGGATINTTDGNFVGNMGLERVASRVEEVANIRFVNFGFQRPKAWVASL